MVWSKYYETGNAVVDRDHMELFKLVKRVLDEAFTNRRERIDTAITFLTQYTLRHFDNEEKLMTESDYPKIAEHMAQHKQFAASVVNLQKKISEKGDTMDIGLEVNKTIVDWLISHVLGSDKEMAEHYRNKKNV